MANPERKDSSAPTTYEAALSSDFDYALREGSRFIAGQSEAHVTLRRLALRLNELGVRYAVAGGMAYFAHGYRRFTEVVEVTTTREELLAIHATLVGQGYVRPFEGSKHLRDAANNVKIEFSVANDRFDDSHAACVVLDGVSYLRVEALIESLLESATAANRKNTADVVELIKTLDLPESVADRLNESVRPTFRALHRELRSVPRRFLRFWSVEASADADFSLDEALAAGLAFEPRRETEGYLVTTDRDLAKRFGLEDEYEFMPDDE